MQRFIVTRLIQGLFTLVAVSVLVFSLTRISGDPRDLLLPPEMPKEEYDRIGTTMGLDRPLPVQYLAFLSKFAKGDLGISVRNRQPVMDMIGERLPNSGKLALLAMLFAILLGFPLGVIAAVKKGSGVDSVAQVVAVLGQATPGFWIAIILIMVFSVQLRWFPPFGAETPGSYVLPAFTMGWIGAGGICRLVRSGMLEVLDAEYITLARSKGVPEIRVIWKHALRNALIPVVTFMGFWFSTIVGMAVIVETVFAWPGIGRLGYEGLLWRDYPVVQGVVMVTATIVIVANLVVDVLYTYINPRVRY